MDKNKEKFLIVGAGGRESAFAMSLCKETMLFAFMSHANPTIIDCVKNSGGKYAIGNINDAQEVARFAKKNNIDYAFVSADDPLANGVIDAMLYDNIKSVGSTKEAAKIEWDKIYSIDLMNEVCPEFTPFYLVVDDIGQLNSTIEKFKQKNMQIVVKPQGLTGGKGVKVMPEHLKTYNDCYNYATDLLNKNEKVLLVEKLEGIEFTIMGITDGKNLVMSPASYDYPFRFESDLGAGTGGMGCFTNNKKTLPFMNDEDFDNCKFIMEKVINKLRSDNLVFNGVLNGGFFKTKDGIKFMEFNGRFGDPEGLNILAVLDSSFAQLIRDIYHQNLSAEKVKFVNKASVVKYLVAKEYPEPSEKSTIFTINEKAIKDLGVDIFFASSIKNKDGKYETLKKSRILALGAISDTVEDASNTINTAIELYINADLDYRKDIGSKENLQKLLSHNFT